MKTDNLTDFSGRNWTCHKNTQMLSIEHDGYKSQAEHPSWTVFNAAKCLRTKCNSLAKTVMSARHQDTSILTPLLLLSVEYWGLPRTSHKVFTHWPNSACCCTSLVFYHSESHNNWVSRCRQDISWTTHHSKVKGCSSTPPPPPQKKGGKSGSTECQHCKIDWNAKTIQADFDDR